MHAQPNLHSFPTRRSSDLRVQVLDLPPDKAKEVADLVSTTDGLIVHFYYDGNLPNGRTSVAQAVRSEEHTSELQSPDHLVCSLLLEKKNKNKLSPYTLSHY